MRSLKKLSIVAAALMASTAMVQAADLLPPPVEDFPPEIVAPQSALGWYIRGDIGFAIFDVEDVTFFQGSLKTGSFEQHELGDSWFIGGGVGYQVTDYFRVDGTVRYYDGTEFDGDSAPAGSACNGPFPNSTCDFDDNGELDDITVLMANAYLDLGTFNGITPYVGAGIGGAHVSYNELFNNQICSPSDPLCDANDTIHPGEESWRFAYAFHAGASIDLTCQLKADAGYTFTRIEGGPMFGSGFATAIPDPTGGVGFGGNGFDDGIDIHTGQIGLRYLFDDSGCNPPAPMPEPIVFK